MKRNNWFKLTVVLATLLVGYIAIKIFLGDAPKDEDVYNWQQYNDSINLANKTFAANHPYKFTDRPRTIEKDSSVYRIAVLGDSFIWGDGLPYDSTWSHKLEQKILTKYNNVEVIHWGRNGWQTREEMDFFVSEGYKFHPDLLVIGYVDNDADMGKFKHMHPDFRNNYWLFYKVWPNLAESVLTKLYARSYLKWQQRLYAEDNMALYKVLWQQFIDTLDANKLDYFVVQTPVCLLDGCEKYYKGVQPMFDTLGLEYIDLGPIAKSRLSNYSMIELRSNPANYHPGTLMTDLFAEEVLLYLESSGRLPAHN